MKWDKRIFEWNFEMYFCNDIWNNKWVIDLKKKKYLNLSNWIWNQTMIWNEVLKGYDILMLEWFGTDLSFIL